MTNYYIFAVLDKNQTTGDTRERLDSQKDFRLIQYKNIKSAVGIVDSRDWSEKKLEERLRNDIDWTKRNVEAHNLIVREIGQGATIVPFRFGTIFRSEAGVKKMLQKEYTKISTLLKKLENKAEWSVSVFYEEPFSGPTHHKKNGKSEGYDWYVAKKKATAETARRTQRINRAINIIVDGLMKMSDQTKEISDYLQDFEDKKVIFKAALLLPKSKENQLINFLEKEAKKMKPLGLLIRLSGPWPPYSFV